jgi:hypothetical protein
VVAALAAGLVALTGCGGEQQDANEPRGEFRIRVTKATFAATQSIAEQSRLRIDVRNADSKTVPNVAITVATKPTTEGGAPIAFAASAADARLADAGKPVWILDDEPAGGTTAVTNTWALGPLRPGETKTFEWALTAVSAGTYTLDYEASPGIDGRAAAAAGERVGGSFKVVIADDPVPARVDDDGNVVRGEEAGAAN